jgi:hypothetical protein
MAIFTGCVFAYVLVSVILGPENKDANLLARDGDCDQDFNDLPKEQFLIAAEPTDEENQASSRH